ncbi:MAG TPA: SGNH/GDSL hydrolase family protein, partial [Acidobacteriaceae bacterium]|nr:SGNH/GDSL hydrolase family protein [Acidobacteriaceae bacterium]
MRRNESIHFRYVGRDSVKCSALLLASILLLTLSGCSLTSSGSSSNSGGNSTGNAGNFTTTVFVGDSLTAGFQNGSLLDTQQPHGYANQIAQQAKFTLTLPLIAPPGAPAVLKLTSLGPPPVIQQSSGVTTGRDDVTVQATDLAVPGALIHDVVNTAPVAVPTSAQEIMTELILGFPGLALGQDNTQLQWAIALKPTTVFVWAGNNDALIADDAGIPSAMTPLASFTTDFTQLITQLSQQTKAHLVIANIPNVTALPYLTPAATVIAEGVQQSGLSAAIVSQMLGIQAGDLVNATGLAEVTPILTKQQAGP